ncbi:MAG TPA: hypothetical protein VGH42_14125 [Verrucomicrobiae bacterium]|jgi:hypothetical protein
MSRFSKSREITGVICAIAAGIFAAHEARGERAYLPSVGSPPLRFQAVATNHLVFNLESFVMAAQSAEASNAVTQVAAPAANFTNIAAISRQIPAALANANLTNQVPVRPETAPGAKNNSEMPVISPNSPSSAGDLLTVTPQMITEYLKPAQNQTDQENQTNPTVFVPAEMQFAPPAPKVPGESQATYKTQ